MEPTEIIREIKRSNLRPEPKQIQPAAIREVGYFFDLYNFSRSIINLYKL